MKGYQFALLVIVGFLGGLGGLVESWNFTFGILMPWLAVPLAWHNALGLLLWLIVFAEIGIVLGVVLSVSIVLVLAVLLFGASHAEIDKHLSRFRRAIERKFFRRSDKFNK